MRRLALACVAAQRDGRCPGRSTGEEDEEPEKQ